MIAPIEVWALWESGEIVAFGATEAEARASGVRFLLALAERACREDGGESVEVRLAEALADAVMLRIGIAGEGDRASRVLDSLAPATPLTVGLLDSLGRSA